MTAPDAPKWMCPKCGEELVATMATDIRCRNDHVARGPWSVFLDELLQLRSELGNATSLIREALEKLESTDA